MTSLGLLFLMNTKKQKVVETGIAVVSNLGTKATEELAVSLLGEGSRIFISSVGVIVHNAIKSTLDDFYPPRTLPK